MSETTYLVAGSRPWSRNAYDVALSKLPGRWHFVDAKEQLTADFVRTLNPRFIFFLHWSWIVPADLIDNYECVCFHMTDVPYGRGGSPLQNLILLGQRTTKLTALRMTAEVDAGPVYLKEDLNLDGSAEEIYFRANLLAAKMSERLIREQRQPVPQSGEPVLFKRRRPKDSQLPSVRSLSQLYDFIRMLDAEGYPRAFYEHDGFRYEFGSATLDGGKLKTQVTIKPIEGTTA